MATNKRLDSPLIPVLGAITNNTILYAVDGPAFPRTSYQVPISVVDARYLMPDDIGVAVQAYDPTLAALAALAGSADKLPYFNGSETMALADLSAFGRSLIDDADAAAARVTLGLGALATVADAPSDGSTYGRNNGAWAVISGLTTNTRSTILATTPSVPTVAYATDTQELFVYNSGWYVFPLEADAENAAPDIGLQFPMVSNDKSGYDADYITDKTFQNVRILENALTSAGAIRTTTSGTFQVYLNGVWNDVVINFRFREDSTGAYELEHKPIGFTEWIEINSGNGNMSGLNGLPIIQQYVASMGACPAHVQIKGRSFN